MASIRKRRNKYQVQVRRRGHKPLAKTFHSRKDAEAWARLIEVQVDRNELPDKQGQDLLRHTTLGQLVERYRDTVTSTKRGRECEECVLNAFLRHEICKKKLIEVSPADFARYKDQRLEKVKPSTVRRQLNPLHHMYEIARDEWGLALNCNPIDKIRPKGTDTPRERRLKPGELGRLTDAAISCQSNIVLKAMHFAIETAMRRGEILNIRWEHYDETNQTLIIPHTKSGYSRTIPLSEKAQITLRAGSKSTNRVFPMTANAFRLAWNRVRKKAEITDLRFHDLRHEAISRLFEKGLSVPEVALISGHRDPKMLFRYTHPQAQRIREKLDQPFQKARMDNS